MCRAKKLVALFASMILLIATLCPAASALQLSTDASEYLNSYGASMYRGTSDGSIRIAFTVLATDYSDYVGVSQLIIYNGNGTRAATITGTVGNGLLRADAATHAGSYTYYGEPGAAYYAILTMYAQRNGGSDSRDYLTNSVTAPGQSSSTNP